MSRYDMINRVNKTGALGFISLPRARPAGLTALPGSGATFISGGVA